MEHDRNTKWKLELEQVIEDEGLAQRLVEMKNGREVWKFPGQKYKAAAVWDEIKKKKDKVAWHRLIWNLFVVLKHAIIT